MRYDTTNNILFTCRDDTIDELLLYTDKRVIKVSSFSHITQPLQPFFLSPKDDLISTEPIQIPQLPPAPTSWRDYFLTLSELGQDLLYDFRHLYNPSIRQFWRDLTQAAVIIATIGSVSQGNGTYGWIISTTQGQRFAKTSGRVFGFNPNSYRTELYAYLSVLKFIHHIKKFLDAPDTVQCKVRIDNEGAVLMLHEIATLSNDFQDQLLDLTEENQDILNPTPRQQIFQALLPESDLIASIRPLHTNTSFIHPDVKWIKAHQDQNKTYHSLDLCSQVNCDADKLAELAHDKPPRHNYEIIPLTPECPIHLDIEGKTITSRFQQHFRRVWKRDALKDYVALKNDWSDSTKQSVDWKLHSASLSPKINQKTHYCKLVHDLLPTSTNLSKWHPFRKPFCKRCGYDREDRDHIIQCPKSDTWFHTFQKDLKSTLAQLHTDPIIANILLRGIQAWRNHTPLPTSEYRTLYHSIIHEQDKIGWRQIFNGRISNKWSSIQEKFDPDPNWGKRVISTIWKHWEDLWQLRNNSQHGDTPESKSQIRDETVRAELQMIYDNRQLYVPSDRQFLEESYEANAAKPTFIIENWLSFYRSLFKKSIHDTAKQSTSCTISIDKYYPLTHKSAKKHTLPQPRLRQQKRRKTSLQRSSASTKRLN